MLLEAYPSPFPRLKPSARIVDRPTDTGAPSAMIPMPSPAERTSIRKLLKLGVPSNRLTIAGDLKWTPFFEPRVKVEAGACSFNHGAKKNEGKTHEAQSCFQGKGCIGGGPRTIDDSELSRRYKVHANQVYQWKRQLLENLERAFESEAGSGGDGAERESELLQKIGELTVERDFWSRGLGRLK